MANNHNKNIMDAPQWVLNKARARKAYVQTEMAQAKARIPREYHDFLVFLPQNEKLGSGQEGVKYNLGKELYDLDVYYAERNNSFYMSIEKPYFTVDGRVQMLRDEHQAAGKTFVVHPPVLIPFNDNLTGMSVTIDSEIYGSATGIIEIGFKSGVDISNPLSNAQTSAIGRALGFLGFGLIGTGAVFSDEEIDRMMKPKNNASEPEKPQQNHSLTFTLRVGNIKINPDHSATAEGVTSNGEHLLLMFPKEQINFVKQLNNNYVIEFVGELNPQKKRVVVSKNSQSKILETI